MFAIRKDNWKLILGDGSGARTKPIGIPFQEQYQLYDLANDITESNNLIDQEIPLFWIIIDNPSAQPPFGEVAHFTRNK